MQAWTVPLFFCAPITTTISVYPLARNFAQNKSPNPTALSSVKLGPFQVRLRGLEPRTP